MGIIYSYCPKCDNMFSYFLDFPKDNKCEQCGHEMSEQDFVDNMFRVSDFECKLHEILNVIDILAEHYKVTRKHVIRLIKEKYEL